MKKSLVITTIATVLVIVVALTTATFAWFSASSVTSVNNQFAVSASDSSVSIYRWLPGENTAVGEFEATPLTENWALGATSDYEWEYTGSVTQGQTPNTAYTLLMPTAEISGTEFAANSDSTINKDGLPSVSFFRGQKSSATQDKVTAVGLHPVAVRFRLMPGKAAMQIAASITVKVGDSATSKDYLAAKATRVVLIGKVEGGATEQYPNIMVASNYTYCTTAASVDQMLTSASAYESTSYVGSTTGTDYVAVLNTDEITSGTVPDKDATATLTFGADPTKPLDCVLYIWFDGGVASDSAALGQVSIDINFADVTPAD